MFLPKKVNSQQTLGLDLVYITFRCDEQELGMDGI